MPPVILIAVTLATIGVPGHTAVLEPAKFEALIERFNADDEELYKNDIPNSEAWDFLQANVPFFECPDKELETTYWFRWWTYRKHLRKTPDGWVVTEFLPSVPWAGPHNTINMAAELHIAEGRWIRNPQYLDDYSRFWFGPGREASLVYTNWLADAIWERAAVTGDKALPISLLDEMISQQRRWDGGKAGRAPDWVGLRENGLYYTRDDLDGSEVSISGHGFRPLTNSAAYGNLAAISAIASAAGRPEVADEFETQARKLKELVQAKLWDPERKFFMLLKEDGSTRSDVRELWGYAPWMFQLPDPGYEAGWRELNDAEGFKAPFGPTFPEQRHPEFTLSYTGHECQWNGPSWPLATSIALTALANLLNDYEQLVVDRRVFFETLRTYSNSHRRRLPDGKVVPWIDENIHPYTGDWISRTVIAERLKKAGRDSHPHKERGKDYNHSTFCDLIITGLVGLRPRHDDKIVVNPLVPEREWDWFCLDRVRYHGLDVTILWDRDGQKYNRGAGFQLLVNGQRVAHSPNIQKMEVTLPSSGKNDE